MRSTKSRASASLRPHVFVISVVAVCVLLAVYALSIFNRLTLTNLALYGTGHSQHDFDDAVPSLSSSTLPPLFIFRRTKKTGSSSMLNELLRLFVPLGYKPLYYDCPEMAVFVRAQLFRPSPPRLLVAEHNNITRAFNPSRQAIIADTIRDGYEQMTSYCRYVQKVRTCHDDLITCLRSEDALAQLTYRWAGRSEEDDDTFINLPLSSAHPALSTTVMRSVLPNATVHVAEYNVRHTACPELPQLRAVYNELYSGLDEQIDTLRKRMLMTAGYPYMSVKTQKARISLEEMLDAAEKREREKYPELNEQSKSYIGSKRKMGHSQLHAELRASVMSWMRTKDGKLILKSRRG